MQQVATFNLQQFFFAIHTALSWHTSPLRVEIQTTNENLVLQGSFHCRHKAPPNTWPNVIRNKKVWTNKKKLRMEMVHENPYGGGRQKIPQEWSEMESWRIKKKEGRPRYSLGSQ